MASILRTLFAYALACLVAGAAIVMFVKTPADMLAHSASERLQALESTGMLILAAATHSAIFAAPFALVAIVIGAILGLRSLLFYMLAGLAISTFGFAALHAAEATSAGTILNTYAATAYVLSGLVGGLTYWLLAGRYTGRKANTDNHSERTGKRDRTPLPIVVAKS